MTARATASFWRPPLSKRWRTATCSKSMTKGLKLAKEPKRRPTPAIGGVSSKSTSSGSKASPVTVLPLARKVVALIKAS